MRLVKTQNDKLRHGTKQNRLNTGDLAPHFTAHDIKGRKVSFETPNDGPVWIAFYRYATCALCNYHFHKMMTELKKIPLQAVTFLVIFDSSFEKFPVEFREPLPNNVALIADPENEISDLYRIERSLLGLLNPRTLWKTIEARFAGFSRMPDLSRHMDRMPAHFLVSPGGQIHTAQYATYAADNIAWPQVDEFLKVWN